MNFCQIFSEVHAEKRIQLSTLISVFVIEEIEYEENLTTDSKTEG